jgi:ABC-2 type transport system permease protein
MFNSRLRSLIRKEFIQIRRDKRTLILVLIIPIMQLFLMGYAATNDVRNVPLAVFDQDRGSEARALLDAYRAADYFTITYEAGSEKEIQELVNSGKARAGLIIPPNYSDKVQAGETGQVMIVSPPVVRQLPFSLRYR